MILSAYSKDMFKYEDYKEKIRNRCFVCGKDFKNSWESYQQSGNCCLDCRKEIINIIKEKKKSRKKNKK